MKEFDFIRRYLNTCQDKDVILGIGDDAAIVRPRSGYDLCFSSDMLLAGRHFFHGTDPADVAHKVLGVNISDMAAMGAVPRWILLSVALPDLDEEWIEAFTSSLFDVAGQHGVTLIGGDTTKGDWVFNVTIVGEVPTGKALRRDAAVVGDDIWISGRIGLAAAALQHELGNLILPDSVAVACRSALLHPTPRVALGLELLPFAHAAQDISDGLAQDLGHILKASGVGAELFVGQLPTLSGLKESLPTSVLHRCLLAGGDDYELVFTVAEQDRDKVLRAAELSKTPVARVGKVNDTGRLKIFNGQGKEIQLDSWGFDHFG
ncbi:thiamine-phosphate kinase [Neisseria weaveri]|uniref:thiamine-phosphate kinase n=1 Tax=Neisseria weaveri TaxID=28091 RepID=UPI0007C9C5D2|nr:thiamine-phosphate kinase [Neisseria weaveri]SAY50255.1 thiamine monophosphate kinase [Neisseria weaveri]